MTQGQRAVIGWGVAFMIGLLIWAMIASAFAQMPPHQYRGPARLTVQFTSPENVQSLCALITSGRLRNVEACANDTVMILPDPCTYPGRYAEVVCHEIGHARGWVHVEG